MKEHWMHTQNGSTDLSSNSTSQPFLSFTKLTFQHLLCLINDRPFKMFYSSYIIQTLPHRMLNYTGVGCAS
ncbi:hypothetical protein BLOT_006614 [Blomia tropicalis]|nr:hypothetical protein BLOT_006614 [Blomia tropicalis]